MRSIWAILIKEFLQIRQDKAMIFIILVVPVIQLVILGTAMSVEIKNLPIGICDYDQTSLSRQYIAAYQSNTYLIVKEELSDIEGLRKLIENGSIKLGLVIPRGFSENITRGKISKVQTLIDGVDGNGANIANGYVNSITVNFIQKLPGDIRTVIAKSRIMESSSDQKNPHILTDPEMLFNANTEPTWHYVPGIMALLVTVISMLLTAFSLVKEKEMGTFEQLMVTPINRLQFIVGKITPFFLLTFIEISISLLIIWLVYGIYVKGSLLVLLLGSGLYLLSSLAIGMFVSIIARTQQQALFIAWFMMIFIIMMSGFLFPIENMPEFLQNLARLNPLLYFIQVLRGVIVKGAVLKEMLSPILSMLILGLIAFTASFFSFRKKTT